MTMSLNILRRPGYWRDLAPHLSIDAGPFARQDVALTPGQMEAVSISMERDGYLALPSIIPQPETDAIRNAILALRTAGLPAVFIYLYDEPWRLFHRLHPLISRFLGDRFALLPNFWAWCVPAEAGVAGWPPHTDCQGQTRFEDPLSGSTLMSLSLWVPLVDVGRDGACMNVLPRSSEAHYPEPVTDPEQIDVADGVALPARAGSVLGWSQDLWHWSSPMGAGAKTPRISLSLEFQNPAFEPMAEPLLDVANPPAFEVRLELILQQFDKYRHMEPMAFELAG